METLLKKSVNTGPSNVSRIFALLVLFIVTSVQRIMAQDTGPSLDHLKKNSAAAKEELEKIRHDEIMSYVYMSVGFAIVIAIAWGTTVMARKRSKREQEKKHRFILKQQELRKHGHHDHHAHHGHALHKARR